MSARPGYPIGQRRNGVSGEPRHRAVSRLLLDLLHGHGAEIARASRGRISERMIQYWMEPQAPHPSPVERCQDFLLAVADVCGQQAAEQIADVICAGIGGRYERTETPAERVASIKAQMLELVRSKADLEWVSLDELLDGHVSADDVLAWRRALTELRRDLDAMDSAVLHQHERDSKGATVARLASAGRAS